MVRLNSTNNNQLSLNHGLRTNHPTDRETRKVDKFPVPLPVYITLSSDTQSRHVPSAPVVPLTGSEASTLHSEHVLPPPQHADSKEVSAPFLSNADRPR